MTNELIKKEVETTLGKATLIIYKEAEKAIEKGWESLYFADNSDTFGSVQFGHHMVVLETNGDVRMTAIDDQGLAYRNNDVDEIRQVLDEGKLDEYEVDSNNWFTVSAGYIVGKEKDVIKTVMNHDEVFEAVPKSMEELEAELLDYAVEMVSWLQAN